MSLTAAMFSGVSGLAAQSMAMATISDNISNTNTIGYKGTKAIFSTLVTESSTDTTYTAGGVQVHPRTQIDRQGLVSGSTSDTHMAIAGDGFFVVSSSANPGTTGDNYVFTRAGTFEPDANGLLRNAQGYYLQGWEIDPDGNIPANRSDLAALSPVNITGLTGNAEATSSISLQANLSANQTTYGPGYVAGDMTNGTVEPHFVRSFQIYDSLGAAHTVTLNFLRTGSGVTPNEWTVEITADTDGDGAENMITSAIVGFNSDGTLDMGATTLPNSISIPWAATMGINSPQAIDLSFGTDGLSNGFTQSGAVSELVSSDVNGALFGAFESVHINEQGVLVAKFDNGTSQEIYKIPIATFANPNGLQSRDGNAYDETPEAGTFTLREATIGGAGKIISSATEASTVDIAEEFTRMIVTQRSYSASGKIITTADEMLEELIRLKR
ncbi:MAG: flagellar hook protein FlgE [Sneathiella sp.]|jgi:flagellar hook protein FlgE|uniref:flagellar hook protein FlgE n=1 Tax=Sneathiella sp. TaxID=1964365 RepID=UPI000C4797BF|nr:flagellar hook protein FlgE [Sneathiella sp.]MAL77630.1 flagellar hook protein FlgE [Sneathiella sp.]|tara:strand:- start:465 stop:1787 length:1323 start_codon:yes stop_codon:yes gene_type:complete